MYRNLYDVEERWISRLFDMEFRGKDILQKQVSMAKVTCEQNYAFTSLKFKVEGEIEKYPYEVRIPVEMRAFQSESAPIVFLLHIIDGIVDELEIFTADLSKIEVNDIELHEVQYEINKEVQIV